MLQVVQPAELENLLPSLGWCVAALLRNGHERTRVPAAAVARALDREHACRVVVAEDHARIDGKGVRVQARLELYWLAPA